MKVLENPCKRISEEANLTLQNCIDNDERFAEAFSDWNNALGNYAFEMGSLCTLAAVAGVCLGGWYAWRRSKKKTKKQ